ncbi:hypothetical protein [Pseudodesulfovibrio sp.]|uniref:hypothetical protein n=1 Tax=unclassified Pseudodesulfovibrio TaxID=2661612 RepID=UPI003B007AD3
MKLGEASNHTQETNATAPLGPCTGIETELSREREANRDLVVENRKLWKENGELKVKIGELNVKNVRLEGELDTARNMAKEYYERLQARAAPEDSTPPEATKDVA